MSEEKKLALLIDSDNVSAKYAQFILQEASKYGELTVKRVYGDWEKGSNGWHFPAVNNSILPIQQTCYIAGKNATDFSMIIDAMDLLYSGSVDGFVLVTSDSDFTRLAIRLREAGKLVVGIGEVKTPLAFTSSCHHFSFLNQVCDSVGNYDEKSLRKALLDYVKEKDDGRLDLTKIDAFLTSRFGNVDFNLLGFKRLSSFIDSFPELRRSSTFVTLKKPSKDGAPKPENAPGEKEITNVIVEYLKRQEGEKDDLSKVSEYVTRTFGKVDFSRFGSKRFAKFIDNRSELSRRNTVVYLAANSAAKSDVKTIKTITKITDQIFVTEVQKYAAENMPKGGNLGQLNNMLLEKYGKSYLSDLGALDFSAALNGVSDIRIEANHVFTEIIGQAEPPKPEAPKGKNKKAPAAAKTQSATPPAESSDERTEPQRADMNAVKRFILSYTVQNDNSVSLPVLGNVLSDTYGKGYLKELGFSTLKKLISGFANVKVKNNSLSVDSDFIDRTAEIEKLVYDFAREDGKRSIKSLSSRIKKSFPEFDFTDYGYAKFSDFINAIDGVRANGYYVEPVE